MERPPSEQEQFAMMILYEPRLAEVRRLENFLDGCQNRVPSHFHWTLPFILTLFIEKSDCKCRPRQNRISGGCLVPIFKGSQFWRFLFGPSLDQEVETVWRNNLAMRKFVQFVWRDFGCVVGLAYVGTLCRKSANTGWTKVFPLT